MYWPPSYAAAPIFTVQLQNVSKQIELRKH